VIRDRRGRRGIAVAVSVAVEAEADGWTTVSGDLNPGDLVSVGGGPLRTGQPVRMQTQGPTS
jgi:hypothetical protein